MPELPEVEVVAKNLQPTNENVSWSKWELNNIGGKRSIKKCKKSKKTINIKIKKSKKIRR